MKISKSSIAYRLATFYSYDDRNYNLITLYIHALFNLSCIMLFIFMVVVMVVLALLLPVYAIGSILWSIISVEPLIIDSKIAIGCFLSFIYFVLAINFVANEFLNIEFKD